MSNSPRCLADRRATLSVVAGLVLLLVPTAASHAAEPDDRVRRILAATPLVDGHNDLGEQLADRFANHLSRIDLLAGAERLSPPLHTDIPRLRRGGVGGVFFSAFVPPSLEGPAAVRLVFEQIDLVHRLVARYPETFAVATSAADVERAHAAGRIAALVGIENGQAIDNSLAVLRQAYGAGARYMTLTHWRTTAWADAATDAPKHGGLSPFGREVIREMNRLGMLVDLSHVSDDTMRDALEESRAPVVFSHSSARALCKHPRNVPDDVLRAVSGNGGVVMVNFAPGFVSEEVRLAEAPLEAEWSRLQKLYPDDPARVGRLMAEARAAHPVPKATLAQVADHVDHVRQVAGVDHVGLGSDFDGIGDTPVGLEDVSRYPALLAELLRRGWGENDLRKLAGENVLRVMRQAEAVAARVQKERPPSEVRFEDLAEPAAAR